MDQIFRWASLLIILALCGINTIAELDGWAKRADPKTGYMSMSSPEYARIYYGQASTTRLALIKIRALVLYVRGSGDNDDGKRVSE